MTKLVDFGKDFAFLSFKTAKNCIVPLKITKLVGFGKDFTFLSKPLFLNFEKQQIESNISFHIYTYLRAGFQSVSCYV